jgi:hypothetical protein
MFFYSMEYFNFVIYKWIIAITYQNKELDHIVFRHTDSARLSGLPGL